MVAALDKFVEDSRQNLKLDYEITMAQSKRKHIQLCHRLLRVSLKSNFDLITSLIVSCKNGNAQSSRCSVKPRRKQLDVFTTLNSYFSSSSYRARLQELALSLDYLGASRGRLSEISSLLKLQAPRTDFEITEALDTTSVEQIYRVLAEQKRGISQMIATLQKDTRDLNIISEEISRTNPASRQWP
jgi:hypothetical protein